MGGERPDEDLDTLEQLGVEVVAFPVPCTAGAKFPMPCVKQMSAVFPVRGVSFWGLPVIISTGVIPCIIWATPEPEWTGDVIAATLCAESCTNHLKRAGVDAKFIFGNPEEMVDELKARIKALRAITYLKNSSGDRGLPGPRFLRLAITK